MISTCHITSLEDSDVPLVERFGIFDPVGLSNDLTLHATHGAENRVLTNYYSRDGVVNAEGSQVGRLTA